MPISHDDAFSTVYHELLLHFLAEVLTVTQPAATPQAFQQALQSYCDELRPWVMPADVPPDARAVFSLLDDCTIDEVTDLTTVRLSPEGEAFFRAWVRRQAVLTRAGLMTDPGRTH
jgi:hypothetical protein